MGSIVARLKSKKKLQKIQSDVENNIFDMTDVNYTGAVVYDGSLTHQFFGEEDNYEGKMAMRFTVFILFYILYFVIFSLL